MAVYADIAQIVAPAEAYAGEVVNLTVKVKNLYPSTIGIMVVGVPEYPGLPPGVYITGMGPQEAVANVEAGATYSFSGSFIMPSAAVTIHVYSYWYGADSLWHLDDEEVKNVSPGTATPEFANFAVSSLQKS